MAKKTLNYKAKISRALGSMVKNDNIIEFFAQENSVNSNLYKRIGKKRAHFIEMEFNTYSIKATLMEALIYGESIAAFTSTADYKPEPDIIAHYKKRAGSNIITVAECKYFSKSGIKRDYFKLWGYYFSLGIEQAQLVIYPKKGTPPPYGFVPSKSIRNLAELDRILDSWNDDEAGVIDLVFNSREAERIVSASPSVIMYKKDDNNFALKMEDGSLYLLDFAKGLSIDSSIDEVPQEYIVKTAEQAKLEAIVKSPTYQLSELFKNDNFINYEGLKTTENPIERNTMIKYFLENSNLDSPIYEKKRNLFIVIYTFDYGFVFGMPNLDITEAGKRLFDELPSLGFGYEKGKTWTYLKPKKEIHDPKVFFGFIKEGKTTINSLIKQIAPEMKRRIGLE